MVNKRYMLTDADKVKIKKKDINFVVKNFIKYNYNSIKKIMLASTSIKK